MDIKDIYRSIRPLRNRIQLNNAISCLVWALAAGGGASAVLALLALVLPIPYLAGTIVWIYVLLITLALSVSVFLRPGILKTIKAADSLGLKERLVTAYELKDDTGPLPEIQRYDALKAVSAVNFRSLYALKIPGRRLVISIISAFLAVIILSIPSMAKEKASNIENILGEVKKQAERIDRERKELGKKADLPVSKLQEINKNIDELLKELKKAGSEAEAVKALSKTKHELEGLKNNEPGDVLKKLAEKLSENALTKDSGQAVKDGNMAEMRQRLAELNERLKDLNENDRKQVADTFEKAAREVSDNNELAQILEGLSRETASGDTAAAAGEMSNLESTLSKLTQDGSNPENAMQQHENDVLQQITDSLDDARRQISDQAGSNPESGQGNNNGESGQQGNSGQDGDSSQGSTEGQEGGQGNNGSEGNGSSKSDKGGSGAGNQSSSGDESGSGSRMPGEKQMKDYENIYVPSRLGGYSESSQVKGEKGSSGQSQWSQSDSMPVEKGNTVPYGQVFGDYRDEAMRGLEDSPIPPVMKDIVREYFSSLE